VKDKPPSREEPLIQALLKQVFLLAAETSTSFDELLKGLDLSQALATTLWRLDPHSSPPSMRALAATLNCDPSTVTFLTDRLEQRGLISRQVSSTDRRNKVITLTPQGIWIRDRLVQTMAASSPLARLSATEQQRLHALLAKAGADPASFTCQTPDPG
jgi:DNA-binding MarR family transcriptional regulator